MTGAARRVFTAKDEPVLLAALEALNMLYHGDLIAQDTWLQGGRDIADRLAEAVRSEDKEEP